MGDEVRRDWWKKEKEEWEAYWKVRDLDSRGTIFPRMKYYVHKWWDAPSTWFRGKIGDFRFLVKKQQIKNSLA